MSTFSELLVTSALAIPSGRVTTYGTLARMAGGGGQAARSVSGILARSPQREHIPFHRIVYAGGKVWQCNQYDAERAKMYKKEGILVNKKGIIANFNDILWPEHYSSS